MRREQAVYLIVQSALQCAGTQLSSRAPSETVLENTACCSQMTRAVLGLNNFFFCKAEYSNNILVCFKEEFVSQYIQIMYSKLVKMLNIKQMFVLSHKVQNSSCVLSLYLMKETVSLS